MTRRTVLLLLCVTGTSAVLVSAAQRGAGLPAGAEMQPPRILSIEPSRVTAGQIFRIILETPKGSNAGIRLTARRLVHQAAAKYESGIIIDNRQPGDINPEDGIIEHVVRTNEGWLPLKGLGRNLDRATERYVVVLDTGPLDAEPQIVTVTGGAEDAVMASVIDGNIETLRRAVNEWARTLPDLQKLQIVPLDEVAPAAPGSPGYYILGALGADGQAVGVSGTVHRYVLEGVPGSRDPRTLSEFQKGSLMISAQELESALALLPKENVRGRAAAVKMLIDTLDDSVRSNAK
jgi:hypothetical protein